MTSRLRLRLSILMCVCLLLALPWGTEAQDQPFVTQIDVDGARKVEEATVRFKLKTRVGDPYSPDVVREDIKSLYSLGYFEDIVVQANIFEGGLRLTFVLHEKPSIQTIRIVGNRKLTTDKIKAKIDLTEGAIVPPGALVKNAEKIRLFYEEEGYYQAKVEGQEERISPQEVAVTFNVVEGSKFDVGEIRILGNQHLREKDIKKRLQTSELYLFFFGGTLKREELRRDLDRIRAYYLDNGFLDIAVEDPEIQLDEQRKKLRIVIQVQEGPQYRIAELRIKGNTLFSEGEIRQWIKSQPGGIFSREGLQGDVVAITDRYADRGYLFADVAPVTDVLRAETKVNVALEVTEGRQAFIRRIEITGNIRSRDKVIRRELRLVEGDVFSSTRLQRSRRNLEELGYFEDVKLDTKRAAAEDQVDLTVDVKEKPTGAFTLGGGYSSVDGPIAVASISQNNLFGLGKRASVSGQLGTKANRFEALYADPHFQDTDFITEVRGFNFQTEFKDTQGFDQSTAGASLAVGHHLFEEVSGSITYSFTRVQIKNVDDNAPFLVQRQAQESGGISHTSTLIFALTRSTLDSLSEPTRGLYARAGAQFAGGFLDAENNFTKYSLELSQYWPLWQKLVGHLRGNVAYGDSFGDTPNLPVQERFFLGGISSIRGFRNFTISPKDPVTGEGLTGGNMSWFINNEILFPLYEPLRMRGLVFIDVGQVYDERDDFGDIFKRRIKRSAGIGMRFTSPIGAIRLEYGFNLAPLQGEKSQVLHFSAGTTF
ncbi:MAG TPA: outer membrane protein assembly factor BamA [Candidatus Methylomirabilis sp.]|nr:outer membrane protein assembly factor BamA [Candidatus Methylomirabilis sp.]